MSLLKTNEIQNYNGSSLTLTASTVSTSAQLNTGGNISVTGSLNVSDDSTTRTNLGLGTVATQDSDSITVTGGSLTGTEIDLKSSGTTIYKSDGTTAVLSESGGVVTLTADEANVGSNALVVNSSGDVLIGSSMRLIHLTGYPAFVAHDDTGGITINRNHNAIVPATTSGEQNDAQDLGRAGFRWDDVYATNGTINTSDATEKENIISSDLSLDFIKKLNPVSYSFIGKTRTHYGLIAQDIEALLSTIGKESKDFAGFIKSPLTDEDGNETGEYSYGLRYAEFISPMIKAIQEQQTIIESQQSQIDALTARIVALETT